MHPIDEHVAQWKVVLLCDTDETTFRFPVSVVGLRPDVSRKPDWQNVGLKADLRSDSKQNFDQLRLCI